jgi:hypothetical protein
MYDCEAQELIELPKIPSNRKRLIKPGPGEIGVTGDDKDKSVGFGGYAVTGTNGDLIVTPVSSDPQCARCGK